MLESLLWLASEASPDEASFDEPSFDDTSGKPPSGGIAPYAGCAEKSSAASELPPSIGDELPPHAIPTAVIPSMRAARDDRPPVRVFLPPVACPQNGHVASTRTWRPQTQTTKLMPRVYPILFSLTSSIDQRSFTPTSRSLWPRHFPESGSLAPVAIASCGCRSSTTSRMVNHHENRRSRASS